MVIEATAVCGRALKGMSGLHTELRSTITAPQTGRNASPELHDSYVGLRLMFSAACFQKG